MLTPRKRFLFKIVAILLPFIAFGILEIIFRLCGIGRPPFNDPYILLYSPSSIFKRIEVDGEIRLRVQQKELYSTRNIEIPEKKPAGRLRIFCVGGSASAGWPHPPEHAYSRYLEEALKVSFPDKSFELYNLSGHAFGSNRVRLVFEELLDLDPDLIILYSGNNEFLEERFYQKPTTFSKKKHQIANLLRLSRVYSWSEGKILKKIDPKNALPAYRRARNRESIDSKIFQKELELRKNPEQFAQVLEHYTFNVEEMIRSAQANKVALLVFTVPSNIREWKPNVSSHQVGFTQVEAWQKLYKQGRQLLFENRFSEAVPLWNRLTELDPNYAESYFWLGMALYQKQSYSEARKAFLQAVDLDYNPFRVLSTMNSTLRQLTQKYQVPCVDLDQIFSDASNGSPGYDLFVDYVHPTVSGNLLIARSALETLKKNEIFGKTEISLPTHFVPELQNYQEETDQGVQHSVIFLCGMMHQYEKMVEVSQKFIPIARDQAKEFAQEVLDIFPEYLEIQKKEIYDTPVPEKEVYLKKIQNFYQKYYSK